MFGSKIIGKTIDITTKEKPMSQWQHTSTYHIQTSRMKMELETWEFGHLWSFFTDSKILFNYPSHQIRSNETDYYSIKHHCKSKLEFKLSCANKASFRVGCSL